MHCASCQRPIEKALRETPGVREVSVNLASREVNVDSTVSSDTLVAAVAGAGFDAVVDLNHWRRTTGSTGPTSAG